MIELTGITWNHTRGFVPMVATAQRFEETHPEVSITWQKRSLQAFADAPLADLARRFDLLVIDHPSIGEAATHELLAPLDDLIPAEFLTDQAANSVGQSHASYNYNGRQWALATDAATPIAAYRPDLISASELPRNWSELIALARKGLVAVPGLAIDALMAFFMLANSLNANLFTETVNESAAIEALKLLRELLQLSAPGSLDRNPIRTWQLLAESLSVACCPFAYGYSNYSRPGYATHTLTATNIIEPFRSTLGGAGLAISASCKHPAIAAEYAQFVASAETQSGLYVASGGQPGHRAAWLSPEANRFTNNFFANTLATLDSAWVRPRWPGFIAFQDAASAIIHRYLREPGIAESDVLADFNRALTKHQR
jgi:multiple sugar transport system substrate-binding protein